MSQENQNADPAAQYAQDIDKSDALSNETNWDYLNEQEAQTEETEEVEPELEAAPEPEEEKEDPRIAAKFAALSRREKEARLKEREIDQKLAQLEEKLATLNAPAPEPEKPAELPLEYRLKRDPLGTLAELGLDYSKLAEIAINDGKITQDMQLELLKKDMEDKYSKEIESIRTELSDRDKRAEEERYEKVIQGYMGELTDFVNTNDEYELIRANDAVDLVYDVIQKHHAATQQILSTKEAADHVEEYLTEEARKLMTLKKFAPAPAAEPKQEVRQPSPTLTNGHTTQVSTKGLTSLSEDESKLQAAQLLKWIE